MPSKYYAVKIGKTPGIYYNWEDCRKMVEGFPGAKYKSFSTLEDANAFMDENGKKDALTDAYAFVDGSFNWLPCAMWQEKCREALRQLKKQSVRAFRTLRSIMTIWESKCGRPERGNATKKVRLPILNM